MRAKLVDKGAPEGHLREIAITKEEFLIGRGPDCDLRLGASAISRHHCLLRIRGAEATLSDLGSSNGTFVNNQRVRSQVELASGATITLGDFTFLFELEGTSGIDWGPKETAPADVPTCRLPNQQRKPASPSPGPA